MNNKWIEVNYSQWFNIRTMMYWLAKNDGETPSKFDPFKQEHGLTPIQNSQVHELA